MRLPSPTNVLLLGSGGRESAFAWKIARSKSLGKLYIAPGNAGTMEWGTNVDIDPLDFSIIKQFVLKNFINLVVVGPEAPLVQGIRNYFTEDSDLQHIPVVGPTAGAARLEGSKEFAKEFMKRHKIPTARYMTVTSKNIEDAEQFLNLMKPPYVLKADGLAAGKGVLIIDLLDEAKEQLKQMLEGKFGSASKKVVIEEFLRGTELSVFVATDGKDYKILPEAKDYKRIGDGDTGPNTGGMGAISPVPFADTEFMEKVRERIIEPTIAGIKKEQLGYNGFIFIGLMNQDGDPYVIEYNVRMGDPEAEVVIPRIQSDIIDLFDGMVNGSLASKSVEISPQTAATVVCASRGYPGDYEKGHSISGLDISTDSILIFQAGTANKNGDIVTNGGRVLTVTALGDNIDKAVENCYASAKHIKFEGKNHRMDIGKDLM